MSKLVKESDKDIEAQVDAVIGKERLDELEILVHSFLDQAVLSGEFNVVVILEHDTSLAVQVFSNVDDPNNVIDIMENGVDAMEKELDAALEEPKHWKV